MVEPLATVPDLLRLVAVPLLGWAAWRDHRTRRVPSRLWWPLIALGLALLAWEGWQAVGRPAPAGQLFLLRAGVSVGVLVPLGLVFHRLGLVGGADAKAFVALGVLFPTYPLYTLGGLTLPLVRPPLGVFSLTAVTNGALLGLLYPVALLVRNLADGELSPASLRARRVPWTALPATHGRLAETPEGRTLRGLDLDALRMYLRWRRASLTEVLERPAELRDPATVPEDRGEPTDGRLDPDEQLEPDAPADRPEPDADPFEFGDDWSYADPWAAEEFLAAVGSAYGTTPRQLRGGLELLSRRERVWVSPGLPYLVPLYLGLLVGLGYGDVLFALMRAVGFA
ncbi:MAG: A24 family peptidase [Halobacteriales archaeon]|nr:A24 family peptidase [Halobacteriales archaeon]